MAHGQEWNPQIWSGNIGKFSSLFRFRHFIFFLALHSLYMPSDHEGFSRDAIKSMLPLLPTGMILRKYLWEVENDRQRERTTKKSFRLIPITRCLDTLLCCNFSFSSFRHVYSCLFFYGERPLKTAKLFCDIDLGSSFFECSFLLLTLSNNQTLPSFE